VKRSVFYSFHYQPDCWRAAQVRNMGLVDGNQPASDNDWEAVAMRGDAAVQAWIDDQLQGRSCTVVLIGTNTAGRKWIDYEIQTSWNQGKALVGVHIHALLDVNGYQTFKGKNPFSTFTIRNGATNLASIVPVYDPPFVESKKVYAHICERLAVWVEQAIEIRNKY
jgi:hypothetical protein